MGWLFGIGRMQATGDEINLKKPGLDLTDMVARSANCVD
jgi:hypothetical protein